MKYANVKQALKQIAQESNRPEYARIVIQDVYDAIQNKTAHPLKQVVLSCELEEVTPILLEHDEAIIKLKMFCVNAQALEILAESAQTSASYLKQIMRGHLPLQDTMQERLEKAYLIAKKNLAEAKANPKPKLNGGEIRQLKRLSKKYGMIKIIANLSGVSAPYLGDICGNQKSLTIKIWLKLQPVLNEARRKYLEMYPGRAKRAKVHRKICPCNQCVESKAKQLHQITEKYCGVAA